ncbi:hypothetical protein FNV43_RR25375 [Rhamnella rubrinervis]|uniref:Uncharacterized protein n=1 Tax=Rhamnella rubrinervis TaxID=2594499 RepID=A0A8K0DZV4_9ROSA|nr:hypothetical protein FNV43_RR25375 [Rhamnella rubrinervis]
MEPSLVAKKSVVPIASGRQIIQSPTYIVRAKIGTPAQALLLAMDTSNDAAWIPCAGCIGCSSAVYITSFLSWICDLRQPLEGRVTNFVSLSTFVLYAAGTRDTLLGFELGLLSLFDFTVLMECLAVVTWIAGKVVDCTVGPVGHKLGFIINYKRNVDNLITETQDLNILVQTSMQHLAANEGRRSKGEDICGDRLNEVREITQEVEKLLGKCTCRGSFHNFVEGYQLSEKVKKMEESIVRIKGEIRFDINISCFAKRRSHFGNKEYIAFDTRKDIVSRIMLALGDDNIRKIGVHGMPGVGKTWLVKEITRDALYLNLFHGAVVVTVTKSPNLEKIQQDVAEQLDLELSKESIHERALMLRNRLKAEKKLLIVLDDVWNNELNLEEVGIVFETDQKGCKILFTSRFEQVLRVDMAVEKKFQVELLSEDEAWDWFSYIVGDLVKDPDYQECGTRIVKGCACLPIAIVTISHALKSRDLHIWRSAVGELENSVNTEEVYSCIKLCYDFIQSKEAKSLFLLCALHEEEIISTEYLVRYCMGLGLFEGIWAINAARDRVSSLVDELKDHCLLYDGDILHTVKMHDVVRDVAFSIAKESHMYRFRDGDEIEECLKKKRLEDSMAISLPDGYADQLNSESLEYKQLGLLWMKNNKSLHVIPDQFFGKKKELNVLYLSNQNFGVLPPSLCLLQSLSTLCLRGCKLEDITLIGELNNLEILDLSESDIRELPTQIGQLTRLRILDLSDCYRLKVIQPNVISHLTRLEELNMLDTFLNWDQVDVGFGERRNASLVELKELVQLTALDLVTLDIKVLPKDLFDEKLERYRIVLRDDDDDDSDYDDDDDDDFVEELKFSVSRCLLLQFKHNESSVLQEYGLEVLLKRSQVLLLSGLQGMNNIVYELDKKGLPELKWFCLINNDTIQYLINSMGSGQIHPCNAFSSLESLWLVNLINLKKISHGELMIKSFIKLRVVRVRKCIKLKNLFPFSIARQLEKIKIAGCEMMEEIVTHEIEDDGDMEVIDEFPQLCFLELRNVSKLKRFCSKLKKTDISQNKEETLILDSVVPFFNGKFSFPKLETLVLEGIHVKKIWDDELLPSSTSFHNLRKLLVTRCKFLKYLFSSATASCFEHLCILEISECRMMKEVMSRTESMDKMSFPKLNYLKLQRLPDLVTFSSEIFIEFPMLTRLCIEDCPEFKTFTSKSEGKFSTTIPSLFNENVAFPSLNSLKINGMYELEMIWQYELSNTADSFCKLVEVTVESCDNLMKVFPSSVQTRLYNLTRLEIRDCEMVEEVFEIQMYSNVTEETYGISPAAQLKYLELCGLSRLKHVWSKDPQGTITFPHLEQVKAWDCPSLESVFPPSVAKGLFQLKTLDIYDCGIQEIVGKEEGSVTVVLPDFEFPQLEEMELKYLPNLVCFYPGLHTSSWPLLRSLVVEDCEKVKVFVSELLSFQETHGSSHHDLLIEHPLFSVKFICLPNLENLQLYECGYEKIWDGQLLPSSTSSFHNLTTLVVESCGFMKYLFSSAVAASFEQLFSLEIRNCQMVEEIMCRHEGIDKVSFPKLDHLKLRNLPNLVTFSSAIFIEFPAFTQLSIEDCPEIQTFISKSEDNFFTAIPSLFNEKVSFPSLNEVKINGMDKLTMIWQYELAADSFRELRSITVENCKNLVKICPSSMQTRLHNLKLLNISKCEMVKEVFEIQMSNADGNSNDIMPATQLEYLDLRRLPKLKYVWSQDPRGTLTFPNLKKVVAYQCPSLKSMFPPSIAKLLFQLHTLYIQLCGIDEIVTNEEGLETVPPEFLFPRLEKMELKQLPNLVSFYPGLHTSSWPSLIKLDVVDCMKVKVFASKSLSFEETNGFVHHGIPFQQPLFSVEKVGQLNMMMMIRDQDQLSSTVSFGKLEELNVYNCKTLTKMFTSNLLRKLLNLRKLVICNCDLLEEVFEVQIPNDDDRGKTSEITTIHLKELCLTSLPKLKHVWSQDPQGTLTFQHLQKVAFFGCQSLKNLFPPSVVKNLFQLQNLLVRNCGILEEIVAKDEGLETEPLKFVFPQLEVMLLVHLPNLVSFYPGLHTSSWPLLRKLDVVGSMKVKVFASAIFGFEETHGSSHHGISFQQPLFSVEKVGLPNLMMISDQHQPRTAFPFGNLKEINVYHCKNLKKMFSSNTLRGLNSLSKLVICDCEMMEEIFDVKKLNNGHQQETSINIHLKELSVLSLPKLKYIWSNDPKGTFTFQDLRIVDAYQCQSLKNLFPPSVAKNLPLLEKLYIKNCGMLEGIVAKEEGAVDDQTTIPTFVFPLLDSLLLHNLPQLVSFYAGLHALKWPSLRWLQVSWVIKLKDLSLDFLCFQKTSTRLIHEDIPSMLIQEQPSFNDKVTFASQQHEKPVGEEEYCAGTLPLLSGLRLYDLPNLVHSREDVSSQLPQTDHLDIFRCGKLKMLSPSLIPFQNLIDLRVTQCHGMLNLLTSQTAKSLTRLERMTIRECKRMTGIIVDDGYHRGDDYDMEGEIVFTRLKSLALDGLLSLTSFYSGKCKIGFPELERVAVSGCFEMQSFLDINGIISTPKLQELVVDNNTTMGVSNCAHINSFIKHFWESHTGTSLQLLFAVKEEGDLEEEDFDDDFEDDDFDDDDFEED